MPNVLLTETSWGWGFWRAHDIGCPALLSSSSCSLTGPAAFHPWGDSRCFCHCAMTQVICSEETQNNPGDKYTKAADLIQVRTAIYKHTFHPQRSLFWFILCKHPHTVLYSRLCPVSVTYYLLWNRLWGTKRHRDELQSNLSLSSAPG